MVQKKKVHCPVTNLQKFIHFLSFEWLRKSLFNLYLCNRVRIYKKIQAPAKNLKKKFIRFSSLPWMELSRRGGARKAKPWKWEGGEATMAHSWSVTGGVKRNDGHSSDENFRPNANYTDDNRSGDYWHAATFPFIRIYRYASRGRSPAESIRGNRYNTDGAQVHIATVKTRIGRGLNTVRSRVHNDRWWIDRWYALSRARAVIRFERPLEKVEYETWDGNGGPEDSFLTH